jgi:hypothetical protein
VGVDVGVLQEGALGWLSFNYMKRIVGPKRQAGLEPYAVVEMGGASSQVMLFG